MTCHGEHVTICIYKREGQLKGHHPPSSPAERAMQDALEKLLQDFMQLKRNHDAYMDQKEYLAGKNSQQRAVADRHGMYMWNW